MAQSKKNKKEILKIKCSNCGGKATNHIVLSDHYEDYSDDEFSGGTTYQICQCQGCDFIRFRSSAWFSEDYDYDENGEIVPIETVTIYPNLEKLNIEVDTELADDLPEKIASIYQETVKAINMKMNILAGGGLRAIVEAICKDKNIKKGNLEKKIDMLEAEGFLTKGQAQLLHEERFIGNKALHEIEAARIKDLQDGLDIIQSMLKTIYILPDKAERLKKRRLKANKQQEV